MLILFHTRKSTISEYCVALQSEAIATVAAEVVVVIVVTAN